jgi:hypothetical protein
VWRGERKTISMPSSMPMNVLLTRPTKTKQSRPTSSANHVTPSPPPLHSSIVLEKVLLEVPEYKSIFSNAEEYRALFKSDNSSRQRSPMQEEERAAPSSPRSSQEDEDEDIFSLFGDLMETDCRIVEHIRRQLLTVLAYFYYKLSYIYYNCDS